MIDEVSQSGAAGHLSVEQLEALHGVPGAPGGDWCWRRHEADSDLVAGDGAEVGWQESPTAVHVPGHLSPLAAHVAVRDVDPGDGGGAGRGPGGPSSHRAVSLEGVCV